MYNIDMEKDYYVETIEIVQKLMQQEKFKEAEEILTEELKMPYIPLKYESQFVELMNEVKAKNSPDGQKGNYVPKDVALDYLLSEDEEKEIMGLELLRTHNLRFDKEVLKSRIETWPEEKNMLKAYLFELLVEQEIDINVSWGEDLILNPKDGSVMNDQEVLKALDQVQLELAKEQSKIEMAEDELQRYLLMTYPNIPKDGKAFGIDISAIVQKMFDDKIELTNDQRKIFEKLKG